MGNVNLIGIESGDKSVFVFNYEGVFGINEWKAFLEVVRVLVEFPSLTEFLANE